MIQIDMTSWLKVFFMYSTQNLIQIYIKVCTPARTKQLRISINVGICTLYLLAGLGSTDLLIVLLQHLQLG